MPYIDPVRRSMITYEKGKLLLNEIESTGELNFAITFLVKSYMERKLGKYDKLHYQLLNDIVGAMEGSKQEFIRRYVNPYEDEKIKQNGDIE